jgi:hypothetical protein
MEIVADASRWQASASNPLFPIDFEDAAGSLASGPWMC